MISTPKPPFRADHVGSLLRPPELHAARARHAAGEISDADLRAVEDAAIRDAIRMQEEVGLQAITDGEFRRTNWWIDFLSQIDGIAITDPGVRASFKTEEGEIEYSPKGVDTVSRLARPHSIQGADFDFLKANTARTAKVTIPSPTRAHFHGGRKAVSEAAYPNMDGFFADLAAVWRDEIADLSARGCTYIQIDDPVLAYFCDPGIHDELRKIGEDPDGLLVTYADLLNACVAGKGPDTVVCIHLCRGNARSGWTSEGPYDPIAEALFGRLRVDGYFLEYDSPRAGDFSPLRFMPDDKIVVLGLVTTKTGKLEDPDDLRRRVDDAARYVPLERLALSPQCGFASVVEGNLIDLENQKAKLRLVVETAAKIWG